MEDQISVKWGWQAYMTPTVRDICTFAILVQYSDKFMHSIMLYSIVLSRSQLYCIVNLLLCGYNTIQCYA